MADNRASNNPNTSGIPIDETSPSPGDPHHPDDTPILNNPAVNGYYTSLKRKNNALAYLIWFGIFLLSIATAVGAYYFTSVREPIIRLEEKFDNIKSQTESNAKTIDEIKLYIYTHTIGDSKPVEQ